MIHSKVIGVLQALNKRDAQRFNEQDIKILTTLASQAAVAIENARLYAVAVEKGRLERELQVAREIQEALMPKTLVGSQAVDRQVVDFDLEARELRLRSVAGVPAPDTIRQPSR